MVKLAEEVNIMFKYRVTSGDTLYILAQKYNVSLEHILSVNPGINANRLDVGRSLNIPLNAPVAIAKINGGPLRPQIAGTVSLFDVPGGSWVCAEINGLPPYQPATNGENPIGPHGFHIHEFGNCQIGDPTDPFQAAGGHWNPSNQPHGNHAGDLPVLFSNQGRANMCFFTNAFNPEQTIGRAIIIHQNPDDFRTQPAGNAGKRLACGVIERV